MMQPAGQAKQHAQLMVSGSVCDAIIMDWNRIIYFVSGICRHGVVYVSMLVVVGIYGSRFPWLLKKYLEICKRLKEFAVRFVYYYTWSTFVTWLALLFLV